MKKLFLIIYLVSVVHSAIAEDPGLPGGDPDVPIDGGTLMFLAAGLAYGARSLKKRNEQKKEGP
ncbi:hypothetical protein DBR11_09415 [Pedobacter sp. HMWF019]|uniref:PID-CTERM protein-sorting domain-containing protein n=1 Tax=Pedobacter sp. HMWF019 TaxID=2056856 RepID=UPI000D3CA228|nr:hypothetical protein [Pedobacter sp. HMWF019]PTT00686.1 hypothetical protein DBR11_09415 [Pedobacter sp. HMWF019]